MPKVDPAGEWHGEGFVVPCSFMSESGLGQGYCFSCPDCGRTGSSGEAHRSRLSPGAVAFREKHPADASLAFKTRVFGIAKEENDIAKDKIAQMTVFKTTFDKENSAKLVCFIENSFRVVKQETYHAQDLCKQMSESVYRHVKTLGTAIVTINSYQDGDDGVSWASHEENFLRLTGRIENYLLRVFLLPH